MPGSRRDAVLDTVRCSIEYRFDHRCIGRTIAGCADLDLREGDVVLGTPYVDLTLRDTVGDQLIISVRADDFARLGARAMTTPMITTMAKLLRCAVGLPSPEDCGARARRMLDVVGQTHDEAGLIDGMAYLLHLVAELGIDDLAPFAAHVIEMVEREREDG